MGETSHQIYLCKQNESMGFQLVCVVVYCMLIKYDNPFHDNLALCKFCEFRMEVCFEPCYVLLFL